MEKLKQMKEALVGCVESQVFGNLKDVDAKELGEAMDMIKDLSEAIYYCTITEAMEGEKHGEKSGKGQHGMMYYKESMTPMYHYPYPVEYYDPRYRSNYSKYERGNQGGNSNSSSRNYQDGMMDYTMYESGNAGTGHAQAMRGYRDGMMIQPLERDPREGRSGQRRKMYMEGKTTHKDKTKQMQELEQYMQELTSDMTEMIADATPEEKQLLQQKISMLATKIK